MFFSKCVLPAGIVFVCMSALKRRLPGKQCLTPVSGSELCWAADGSSSKQWQTNCLLILYAEGVGVALADQRCRSVLIPDCKKKITNIKKYSTSRFHINFNAFVYLEAKLSVSTWDKFLPLDKLPAWWEQVNSGENNVSVCDGKPLNPWRRAVVQGKQLSWATRASLGDEGSQTEEAHVNII